MTRSAFLFKLLVLTIVACGCATLPAERVELEAMREQLGCNAKEHVEFVNVSETTQLGADDNSNSYKTFDERWEERISWVGLSTACVYEDECVRTVRSPGMMSWTDDDTGDDGDDDLS